MSYIWQSDEPPADGPDYEFEEPSYFTEHARKIDEVLDSHSQTWEEDDSIVFDDDDDDDDDDDNDDDDEMDHELKQLARMQFDLHQEMEMIDSQTSFSSSMYGYEEAEDGDGTYSQYSIEELYKEIRPLSVLDSGKRSRSRATLKAPSMPSLSDCKGNYNIDPLQYDDQSNNDDGSLDSSPSDEGRNRHTSLPDPRDKERSQLDQDTKFRSKQSNIQSGMRSGVDQSPPTKRKPALISLGSNHVKSHNCLKETSSADPPQQIGSENGADDKSDMFTRRQVTEEYSDREKGHSDLLPVRYSKENENPKKERSRVAPVSILRNRYSRGSMETIGASIQDHRTMLHSLSYDPLSPKDNTSQETPTIKNKRTRVQQASPDDRRKADVCSIADEARNILQSTSRDHDVEDPEGFFCKMASCSTLHTETLLPSLQMTVSETGLSCKSSGESSTSSTGSLEPETTEQTSTEPASTDPASSVLSIIANMFESILGVEGKLDPAPKTIDHTIRDEDIEISEIEFPKDKRREPRIQDGGKTKCSEDSSAHDLSIPYEINVDNKRIISDLTIVRLRSQSDEESCEESMPTRRLQICAGDSFHQSTASHPRGKFPSTAQQAITNHMYKENIKDHILTNMLQEGARDSFLQPTKSYPRERRPSTARKTPSTHQMHEKSDIKDHVLTNMLQEGARERFLQPTKSYPTERRPSIAQKTPSTHQMHEKRLNDQILTPELPTPDSFLEITTSHHTGSKVQKANTHHMYKEKTKEYILTHELPMHVEDNFHETAKLHPTGSIPSTARKARTQILYKEQNIYTYKQDVKEHVLTHKLPSFCESSHISTKMTSQSTAYRGWPSDNDDDDHIDEERSNKLRLTIIAISAFTFCCAVFGVLLKLRPFERFDFSCQTAKGPIPARDFIIKGYIVNSTESLPPHAHASDQTNGIWYWLKGNGRTISASTCTSDKDSVDTTLELYNGECGSLKFIQRNDDGCELQSLVSWFAEAEETYFLLVSAKEGQVGPFDLRIHDIGYGDILSAMEESSSFPFWAYIPIAGGAAIMLLMALFWFKKRRQERGQSRRQVLSG